LHAWVPAVPHIVGHPRVLPSTQVNPSSGVPSASSSQPLQTSVAVHAPYPVQLPLHARVPVEPHVVVHAWVEPCAQVKPSSGVPSLSSSHPLQTSVAVHAPKPVQSAAHVREPVVPQVVLHGWVVLRTQAKPSSGVPSPSSSQALHSSVPRQAEYPLQSAAHVCEPAVPQDVVHIELVPRRQGKPSSATPSPSSSQSLQVSLAAAHVENPLQSEAQVREPEVPQLVVHPDMVPRRQVSPSSTAPLASSSQSLHVSVEARQGVSMHAALQV
jgi:hypothetical protein